ncbi:MAG: nucleoside kinase, partial [Muribaculaceae bacterium]|nr:nucleoside kinase [Muribaculaceae bacterium]
MTQLNIYCRNTEEYLPVEGGTTLAQLYALMHDKLTFKPICARVNNKTEGLTFPLFTPKQVEFLDADTPSGRRVYVRSLCMMLYRALIAVAPELSLRIELSIAGGYFCRLFDSNDKVVIPSAEIIDQLSQILYGINIM